MNVLQVSWSDRHGGAAIAASRLNEALNRHGVASQMLSISGYQDTLRNMHPVSTSGKLANRISARLDRLPLRRIPRSGTLFSPALAPERNSSCIKRHDFDIAHLHWINNGFIKIENIARIARPLVWTLHDMWPFTGGCHYSAGCERYVQECGACPQLSSSDENDLSRGTFRRKALAWPQLKMTVVTPSRWLAGIARSSSLFKRFPVEVIPNCVDTEVFSPQDRNTSRAAFGLPPDAVVLLFGAAGADDRRKGFHLLAPALKRLASLSSRSFHLAVFGQAGTAQGIGMPFPVSYLGSLSDSRHIAQAYSAADVFVMPSLEDNLPNTVMESSSCGVPSVAFRAGGLPDMIIDRETGALAKPFDPSDLAAAIHWLVEDSHRLRAAGQAAQRYAAARYSPQVVASQYAEVYQQLLDRVG